ncbi:hypothetical protein BD324DRAFT_612870 [Kockovaella imperatae]|uniref:PI-PLC Y-box domain-containing protein n=1 Tax=Kockovaella imperatae TaxID=4999 RepID=A0A1Y1USM3_9TREE|nr:hypothetical protein BD324DRAFT_612870 [Kockovaella imperatae]ORX41009.1 hypothetical protein BD324DRAFT_612870 [Kockovaella imperatae]
MPSLWGSDAPQNGAPPRYQAVMSKLYPHSMRPVLMVTAGLGTAWAVISGVSAIRDMGGNGETGKMKAFDLILGIMYFVVTGLELFGFFVGFTAKIRLAKILAVLAPVAAAIAVGTQIVSIASHYINKSGLISQCVNSTVGDIVTDGFGDQVGGPIDQAQAEQICGDTWSHSTWAVFGWLVFVVLVSAAFAAIAITYYRQLANPSSMRPQNSQPQEFAMQPPPPGRTYSGQGQQQPWMVPPYPGPPPEGTPFEKSDYQPSASWANGDQNYMYAPPSGSPPGGSQSRDMEGRDSSEGLVHDAQEEAWQRAQTTGVTAHLTGHASNSKGRDDEEGYTVTNRAEDDAWENARTQGVTAHFTGHASGARRENDREV